MTHSMLRADRPAHLKIVAVALVGAAVVVLVGIAARVPEAAPLAVQTRRGARFSKPASP